MTEPMTMDKRSATVALVPESYQFLTADEIARGRALESAVRATYEAYQDALRQRNAWLLTMTRAYAGGEHERRLPTALGRLLDLERTAVLKGVTKAELDELRAQRNTGGAA